jgi:hypothetical protein
MRCAAAGLVAFNHLGEHLGKQVALGALSLGVHRVGPIVIARDLPEVGRG